MSTLAAFHPAVHSWFKSRLGQPTLPQREGWPLILEGRNVLIAAPTGSGKTLAGFLCAIDSLFRQPVLPDETQVVYVSPLRALSNDVQKNLQEPLAGIRAMEPGLPELRVLVRTGDTPARERAAMAKRPPHILVTTPESLYLLLTSDSGRAMLATTRSVIVDEIHALVRDKRGSHLALSLERLEALCGRPLQRLGLSATQKPLSEVGAFLAGAGRECALVDAGSFRALDLAVEVPPSPLGTVCSHEQWEEIYTRLAELVRAHRTTLVFVNTRKMAERIAAQLTKLLGEDAVTSHHGSLSRDRRLSAEQRLKAGTLRALVATASLELGIDIGEVDLVVQVGATRAVATLLQRVGRSGHALGRVPKGRMFPLTLDELVEAAALLRCVRDSLLDRTASPPRPLDILAQQVVAECVARPWDEADLFAAVTRAWPYRELTRAEFDEVVLLHADASRGALLHRDGVNERIRATRRARLLALMSGGAIPDTADYQVRLEPEGTVVGTVNEDWAIESNGGDIFQLGNASWRILRVEPGVVRVADAKGQPPSLPFWLGEGPGRTRELSGALADLREGCAEAGVGGGLAAAASFLDKECGEALGAPAALQLAEYVLAGHRALGCVPTERRVVLERFFDEAGGTQLVVHAPFGSRINRAWGLALRKRFCVGFGFELQAAANEEAIVLSLGPQHSFPLEDVFDYLHPTSARDVLVQALLAAPMFETRWRWNAQRALLLARSRNGKRVPAAIQRMRATDLLAAAFPQALACPETLPPGPIPVPEDHPIVRQTVEDCLTEAMDVEGFLEVLAGLRDGTIERRAIDTPEPSAFARGILSSQPYTFLDDAPLEERRTQAVMTRRILDVRTAEEIGALDASAVERVREEAWPRPQNAEEVHEALLWMGYVTESEGAPWRPWLDELVALRRVVREGDRFLAVETSRDPKSLLRGRLEALGPVFVESPADEGLLLQLESEGVVLRARIDSRWAFCDRRLLARIHRYTLDRLRREIEAVSAAQFLRFLSCWQHVDAEHRVDGPAGVAEVVRQLAGFEVPAAAWEGSILPARVRGYKREWLDQLTLAGDLVWGRLWGAAASPVRRTPVALVPRDQLETWTALAAAVERPDPAATAREILDILHARGAVFVQELARSTRLPMASVEEGLGALVAQGRVTCDSFGGLRWLLLPAGRRRSAGVSSGRWSLLGSDAMAGVAGRGVAASAATLVAAGSAAAALPAAGSQTAFDAAFAESLAAGSVTASSVAVVTVRAATDSRNATGGATMAGPGASSRADWNGSTGNGFADADARSEFVARCLLRRTGVVFRRTLARERIPVPWRDVARACRRLEARGEIRGGRFVAGFDGEQYALPEAVMLLRSVRRRGDRPLGSLPLNVSAADPLNFQGILTPDERVPAGSALAVRVG